MVDLAHPVSPLDRLMAEVCNDGRVSVPMADVAEALGVAEKSLVGPLREAIGEGWLQAWSPKGDGEASVTLGPALAASLAREPGPRGMWRPIGSRPKRYEFTYRSGRREISFTDAYGENALVALDRVAAPEVHVSDAAPSVLLGLRDSWPIAPTPDGRCGGCGDRGGPRSYCTWCNQPCGSSTAKAVARGEAERLRRAKEPRKAREPRKAKSGKGAA